MSSMYTKRFLKRDLSENRVPNVFWSALGELLRPNGQRVNRHLRPSGAVKLVRSLLVSFNFTCQKALLTSDTVMYLGFSDVISSSIFSICGNCTNLGMIKLLTPLRSITSLLLPSFFPTRKIGEL